MNAVDAHDEIRNARPCDVIRKTADGKMAAFRCRRDPCGFVCLILTYFSVFYADYVVIQYVLIPAYSERWVPYERSFKEPAFGSRNSTRDLTRSSLYKCCSLESPIATAVLEQTAFRMCFARTVFTVRLNCLQLVPASLSLCGWTAFIQRVYYTFSLLHCDLRLRSHMKLTSYHIHIVYCNILLNNSHTRFFLDVYCVIVWSTEVLGSIMCVVYIIPFSMKL